MRMCPSWGGDQKAAQVVGPDGVEIADDPVAGKRPRPFLGLGGGGGADQEGQECDGRECDGRECDGRECDGRECEGRECEGRECEGRECEGRAMHPGSIALF